MKKAFISLFSGGAFGKVIGFGREILLAALFGTGLSIDAYRAAQSAVLVPSNFFTNDALNAGFVPLYAKYKISEQNRADNLFSSVYYSLLVISVLITIGLILLNRIWADILVPGFNEPTKELVSSMIIAMAIGLPFYVQSTILSYLEMANGSFILTSIRSSVQSIGLILGTVAAYFFKSVVLLAWGFTFAYVVFFIWALIWLKKRNLLKGGIKIIFNQDLKISLLELYKNIRPLILISFFVQINIIVERVVASKIGEGTLASLEYAKVLSESGLSLIALPLGLIGLAQFGKLTKIELNNKIIKLTKALFVLLIPISTILYFNATTIISLIYGRGEFVNNSTIITASILEGISFGFWAYVISYFYIKVLNSQFLNKEVLYLSFIAILCQIATNYFFYPIFGEQTLGISLSIYGLILLLLTSLKLKIWKPVGSLIVKLLFGIILLSGIILMLKLEGILLLSVCLIYWFVFCIIFKEIRLILLSLK